MNETTLYRRNFLLHLQERTGSDGPFLRKEPAQEQPSRSHLDQLHNEYVITRQLRGVRGVRPALAKEGTESRPVLLLEYIRGQSLAELIRSGSLEFDQKLQVAVSVVRALSQIHDHQVMHKDVSSGNILVASQEEPGSQGGVYVIDFGLASTMRDEVPSQLAPDDTLVGTLAYISPEQTGRMNRKVDYRTDLYSLGVCLYELFSGHVPFENGDALEIIHAHIARQPQPPHQIDAGIPVPLSDMILKLMAKNAEDRYQTAAGLQVDLQRCLDQWQDNNRVEPFELGADDFTGRLQIPQKLYGRQVEVEQLKTILERAVKGSAQLLLVAGYSGVGKTSIVHEIEKDVISKQGIFMEGKFDQQQRILPYSAWRQALTQLVNYWLAEGVTSHAGWRETILDAVGDNGRILIDAIPALEQIIGPQPEVPELRGIENQNRFSFYFNRFISNLATPEHPLVVFLDDLQWIDPASLDLIESLLAVQSTSSFLIIGAYRNNEVTPNHPLMASQERMRGEHKQVTTITLKDLAPDDTNHMLADTLLLSVADCRELSQALVDKTAGNPFYVRQQLYALESEELLYFDHEKGRWVWEEDLLQSLRVAGNVVDLMIRKIKTLPIETQYALSMAACIGSRFKLSTLDTITGPEQTDVPTALNPALQEGLIYRSNGICSFVHDRIQEAGYSLIPQADLPQRHLEMGRLLLANTPAEEMEEELFAIVSHLNVGRQLIETDSEKTALAELNLNAGLKAKAAAAFADAKEYVDIGFELIGQGSWQNRFDLTLSLHNEKADLAALTGQYEEIADIVNLVYDNVTEPQDRLRISMTRIEAEMMQYRLNAALEIGLGALRELGIEMPSEPGPKDYQDLRDEVAALLESRTAKGIVDLPVMSDAHALACSTLLASQMSTYYIGNPKLFPVVTHLGAIFTLRFGLDAWSAFFCGEVGSLAFASIDRNTSLDEAYKTIQFGKRMHELAHWIRGEPVSTRGRTKSLMVLAMGSTWIKPIQESIELSRANFRSGFEEGDIYYGSYGAFNFANLAFPAGVNLEVIRCEVDDYRESLRRVGQKLVPQLLSMHLQAIENFQKHAHEPGRLKGDQFDEQEELPAALAENDKLWLHTFALYKLMLAYHFDVDQQIREYATDIDELVVGGPDLGTVVSIYLYFPLAKLRLLDRDSAKHPNEIMGSVNDCLHLLEIWSRSVPSTFQHKLDLVTAEKARVTGDLDGALTHYEHAISGARASGCTQEEALANELYARFWIERGNDRFSGQLMREAHSLYRKWGALGKVEHLSKRYPNLLIGPSIVTTEPGTQTISGEMTGDLDLLSVLKASQRIAGEIELNSLLATLMSNVIENSGAQRGHLILEEDGQWVAVIQADADKLEPHLEKPIPIAKSGLLADSIVHYVARTQKTVVLEDASRSGEFVHDPYVQAHQPRSVLCTPLVNQAKTSAILYLENNLAPEVFSPQRASLLRLLSSQMAISIDNAQVHADLETLLESRSKALASAEIQVRSLFEDSPLGIAVSSVDGEILATNEAMLKMLRVSEEDILQSSVSDFYADPSDRDMLLKRVEESGFVQDFGVQVARNDGSTFHANLNMSNLVLEGSQNLLVMVEDVTAQITAEQETATLEERARLARELHDAVTQTIVSASLLSDATAKASAEGRSIQTQELVQLSQLLRGAVDEARTMLLEMRPSTLQDRTLGQLLAPLAEAARARSRVKVNLQIEGDRILPENVTTTLQRIAQETLQNVTRHAEAKTVNVDLACDPDGVTLRITDDGRGFDVDRIPAGHHGLSIMLERAQEIGAVFVVHSKIDGGTEISVTWS